MYQSYREIWDSHDRAGLLEVVGGRRNDKKGNNGHRNKRETTVEQ